MVPISWEPKGPDPPNATFPPGNKALLRDYLAIAWMSRKGS